ncbi:hypothetical protein VTN96DRAFT_344 [Rasamsonia emersonii]
MVHLARRSKDLHIHSLTADVERWVDNAIAATPVMLNAGLCWQGYIQLQKCPILARVAVSLLWMELFTITRAVELVSPSLSLTMSLRPASDNAVHCEGLIIN